MDQGWGVTILVDGETLLRQGWRIMPKAISEQYKQQCVDAVLVLGKTREQVSREYEVSTSALGRWLAKARGTEGTGSGSAQRKADPASQDPHEMAKRIRELELENEFLKKAAAFFAKDV